MYDLPNKKVPMIELHDVTCSSNVNDLLRCAQWFSNNIAMLNKYQKYILINIANEWVRTFFRKIKNTYSHSH